MPNSIKSINPKNYKLIKTYEPYSDAEIEDIIKQVDEAGESWKKSSFSIREKLIKKLGLTLEKNKERLAKLMTNEMGKPISQAIAEVEKCVTLCEYYAENAKNFLKPKTLNSKYSESYAEFEPLGVILAIMPWNFPLWQVMRFAVPTIMAGNSVVLKHANNVSGCSLEIEKIFLEAGFEENIFRSVLANNEQTHKIIENNSIKAVSLTGSTKAGRQVAETAGKNLKKCVLELGGSDPYIILKNADIKFAAKTCAESRMINNGQSCIAAKRFIIKTEIYDKFLEEFKKELSTYKASDPIDESCKLGPLVGKEHLENLQKQVNEAIENGAKCIFGNVNFQQDDGAYFGPIILTNISKNNPAYNQEFFGPVALVFKVADENEAIKIANDSNFGLGAGIFTKDTIKAKELARKLNAGNVFINDFVKSDPALPFGGVKESGYGRELAEFGIHEFVNMKTIAVK